MFCVLLLLKWSGLIFNWLIWSLNQFPCELRGRERKGRGQRYPLIKRSICLLLFSSIQVDCSHQTLHHSTALRRSNMKIISFANENKAWVCNVLCLVGNLRTTGWIFSENFFKIIIQIGIIQCLQIHGPEDLRGSW